MDPERRHPPLDGADSGHEADAGGGPGLAGPKEDTPSAPLPPARSLFAGPLTDFEHIGGIHVTDSILWCDAARRNGLNFLSSARAGEVGKNRRVLCTEATYRLATRGKGKVDALIPPYDHFLRVGELGLSLHPAGHLLGGAQLRIERDGRVLVYAGDISTRSAATTLPAEPVRCDALALPATHAGLEARFPSADEVFADLRRFVDGTLESRRTPALLAEPLGIAQELLVRLGRAGYKVRVHRAIADVTKIYASLQVAVPEYKRFTSRVSRGEVLLFPPILRAGLHQHVSDARVALVGPRAIDAGHVHQLGVAGAFPLSNVADREDLLAFVEATGAGDVYLTGGEVESFGAELRRRGHRVRDLLPREQLELF